MTHGYGKKRLSGSNREKEKRKKARKKVVVAKAPPKPLTDEEKAILKHVSECTFCGEAGGEDSQHH